MNKSDGVWLRGGRVFVGCRVGLVQFGGEVAYGRVGCVVKYSKVGTGTRV